MVGMLHETALFIVSPARRPPYALVAAHLWGGDVDFDSDGNSTSPDDPFWTELTITRRPDYDESVSIDPVSQAPLVLKVVSQSAALADRTASYLATYCSCGVVAEWPT